MTNNLLPNPTPEDLMAAVKGGNIERVRDVLAAEVDVNAAVECGKLGMMTPLCQAIMHNMGTEIVALLLDHGADVEAVRSYKNFTPLMQAVLNDRPKTVTLLLERGADMERRNADDQTALTIALIHEHEDIKQILRKPPPRVAFSPVARKERVRADDVQEKLRAAAAKKPKARFKQGGFFSP